MEQRGKHTAPGRSDTKPTKLPHALFTLAAVFAAALVGGDAGNVGLSSIALVYGVIAFLRHGGPLITTVGLANFAFALFVGYAGIQAASDPYSRADPKYLGWALMAA